MKLNDIDPFKKYENVDAESQKRWEEGLAKLKKELAEAAPEMLREQRRRAAETAEMAANYWFC